MPRTKGAKNRASIPTDERIVVVKAEIASLQEQIKKKKDELKRLNEQKAEEDRRTIMRAVEDSGKTVDEILALLCTESKETKEIQIAG